ncbi:MAG TPA: putative O-glycosylation ligase, exosortase A system-associated [Sphingobium sp.]|uniref:putative O-glycosylation ligase, exosortase A system-associated n=1 Tax=Sphingobium sp. TaxID=1912891 RepID=UPI002ECFFCD6
MRDLVFIAFLCAMFALGSRRPFLLILTYAYIDIVSPQRLTYLLLNSVPISLIAFVGSVGAWLVFDDKSGTRLSRRHPLLLLLLLYCFYTTTHADFPIDAANKWAWVWKAIVFAMFLPLTLRTRLRIEAVSLVMVLSAGAIIINGGLKTAMSGGGYGTLNLLGVENNAGLYEGSIISTVAICIIPLILYLSKYGTIFPSDWRVKIFAWCFCLACLLIPIGTEARTGLICAAVLAGMMFLHTKRKALFAVLGVFALICSIPFLPSSFTNRMDTIANYQGDQSASTRVAVWNWTIDYVKSHPLGGGFDAYRSNSFRYQTVQRTVETNGNVDIRYVTVVDQARAYHSSYFEMLGEQGYLGLLMWLVLNLGTALQSYRISRRYKDNDDPEKQWIAPYALAMSQGHIVYMIGSFFVGIAFQPFIFMLMALQIGLSTYVKQLETKNDWQPMLRPKAQPAGAL